ncbi:MAG: hypothetical protein JST89_08505 [Cyanobacteria bacterium SZAS-4]|nr:hypothetical protein [Cyanobacteria bacterium SZAS-4]
MLRNRFVECRNSVSGKIFICTLALLTNLTQASIAEDKSAASGDKSATQKESERIRAEHKDRIDRIVRESELRFESMQKNRLIQTNLTYSRALDAYEKAKQNKRDLPAFIHAAVGFAVAAHDVRDNVRASELYSEAVDAYLSLSKDSPSELECRRDAWSHMGYLSSTEFQSKFAQLFKIFEQRTSDPEMLNELNNNLRKVVSEQSSNRFGARSPSIGDSKATFDEKQFWKNAIEIRSAIRGANDPSLQPLLQSYVSACEKSGDVAEAEKTFVRLATLKNKDSDDADYANVRVQLDLTTFYLRHSMPEKAVAAYNKAMALSNGHKSQKMVSQLLSLASEFKSHSNAGISDKIIIDLLNSGGDQTVQAVDGTLNTLVSGYLNSFDLVKAQTLLAKRVEASKSCSNDQSANRWRLKLSDVDLALGQDAESNKLFEQVKTLTALSNGDVNKLNEDRQKLIQTLKSNKASQSSNTLKPTSSK